MLDGAFHEGAESPRSDEGLAGYAPAVSLVCEGCGEVPRPLVCHPYPFRCESAGVDAADHVLAPRLDPSRARWPKCGDDRPFVKFRHLLHAHAAALSLGLDDDAYLDIVERLDERLHDIDGRSFRTTPFFRGAALEQALSANGAPAGEIWIKNDTINVSGSHKARHLFGVLLHLEIVRQAGLEPDPAPPLAIASCGNAALAAAVCARAANRDLVVMVPPDAHPNVLARLRALGADVRIHARAPGELGDPTVAAFRRAIAEGALPFACQGTECGLTLDGGKTLAYEIASAHVPFDRLFVQIGGGALASSVGRGLIEAHALGALARLPRIMPVQTTAVAPLPRAYDRLVQAVRERLPTTDLPRETGDLLADRLRAPDVLPTVQLVLSEMARARPDWLPPWPSPVSSRAHGILDDETYDAMAILRMVVETGGSPITVPEATVERAESLCHETTSIEADATGTAGLAGLLDWHARHAMSAAERSVLLFTGARR